MRTSLFFLLAALIVFSSWHCHAGKQHGENEADQLRITELQQAIEGGLDTLIWKRNALSVQGRALTAEEQAFIQAVYRLESEVRDGALSGELEPGQKKQSDARGRQTGKLEFLQRLKLEVDSLQRKY